MWAQRSWVGRFLPHDTPVGRELWPYSHVLNAVEGNTTFYAAPPALSIAKWKQLAAPGFRFVFKVPRSITHDRRLREVHDDLREFVELMAPLDELIGGFTLQLPPTFGPSELGTLREVLERAPTEFRWSVEVRHHEFFGGDARRSLERLLVAHGAERVLLDTTALFHRTPITHEGREEWRTKPRVPLLAEALTDRPIVRFIGGDHPEFTDAGLAAWHVPVAEWLDEGRTPTVFVHTPDNSRSPVLARGFHDAIRTLVPELDPLPTPFTVLPPEQPSLF
jgi:uncharacterized protein YecE (DUF72 family)